jgi:hypothetical protein
VLQDAGDGVLGRSRPSSTSRHGRKVAGLRAARRRAWLVDDVSRRSQEKNDMMVLLSESGPRCHRCRIGAQTGRRGMGRLDLTGRVFGMAWYFSEAVG